MAHAALFWETANLEGFQDDLRAVLGRLSSQDIIGRIWHKDHTVWKLEPREISNRLAWLDSPEEMLGRADGLEARAREVLKNGFRHVLLLGMGGSSLAPEVFARVFGRARHHPRLAVLDSTVPDAVHRAERSTDLGRTLFIVSSKSGTTVETQAFFKYFYQAVGKKRRSPGGRFLAITDPGTPLEKDAKQLGFLDCVAGHPEIGGRFSALSVFGLVPASLAGIDIRKVLSRSLDTVRACREPDPAKNPGAMLGATLGLLALRGRDKATFVLTPALESFGLWLEQLIAESTGKEGTGIVPVIEGPSAVSGAPGDDKVYVVLTLPDDKLAERTFCRLQDAAAPCLALRLSDPYDLGSQFFLWEMATAVAGHILSVNPFDQPNVAAAKQRTLETLAHYGRHLAFPADAAETRSGPLTLSAQNVGERLDQTLQDFLSLARPGDYVAVLAYLDPDRKARKALDSLLTKLRERTGLAATLGLGPRYLHSTGQLHKGGKPNGLFIILTAEDRRDMAIPESQQFATVPASFGLLKEAQARGDFRALREAGRRVVHIRLGPSVRRGVEALASLLR